jgi:hypothetical protein
MALENVAGCHTDFPQPRSVREKALARHDLQALITAYKVALRIPLATDVSHLSARVMIDAILDAECGPGGEFVRWPSLRRS